MARLFRKLLFDCFKKIEGNIKIETTEKSIEIIKKQILNLRVTALVQMRSKSKPIYNAKYEPLEYVIQRLKIEIISSAVFALSESKYLKILSELEALYTHSSTYIVQITPITFGPPP